MRASRYFVLFYVAMAALPLLLLALTISYAFAFVSYLTPILLLLSLDLLVFGLLGLTEVLAGKKSPQSVRMGEVSKTVRLQENPDNAKKESVTVAIERFDPRLKEMQTQKYKVPVDRSTTVLDALISIKSKQDNALAVRYSCRMGICGSCGLVINGKPALACESGALACSKDNKITVTPMLGHPLLRDLVTDFDDFFEKHMKIEPGLYRVNNAEKLDAQNVYEQTTEQMAEFLPYSYCIMCGLCNDACPVVNSNPAFAGPQALAQTYRYLKDSRDQKGDARITPVDRLTGLWGCEYAGACSAVCPKGVDPASAIQLLKAESAKSYFHTEKKEQVQP